MVSRAGAYSFRASLAFGPRTETLRSPDGIPSGRLLLPCFFSLRAQLLAAAFATAGRAHRVPSVALHADHLVQPAALGLRKAGHHHGEPPGAYEGFATGT